MKKVAITIGAGIRLVIVLFGWWFSSRPERGMTSSVSTNFRWIDPNDKIVVDGFDDPKVQGVACHISRVQTGGVKGGMGMAEDTSDASIACRQIGPIQFLSDIKDGERVFDEHRILVSPLAVPSSLHLVIGPYPEEEESHMISVDGRRILIRPVKPEDAPLFTALFKTLSPTTIYYRFFGTLKELSPEMLARFTQIDYDREIALVAIDEDSESDCMLGVARIIGDADGKTGEFAVLVSDAWQGKGIGGNLLEKCFLIAEKQGFKTVHGIVLKENRNMLELGKKLGFSIERNADDGDKELVIHFISSTMQ